MDFVSPILDVAGRLWNLTAKHAAYMCGLQESVTSLRIAMAELRNVAEDVKNMVERAEENCQMRRKKQVDDWLHSVEDLEKEVMDILQKGDQAIQQKCLGTCCPKNCWSSYKIGKKANKNLGAVTALMEKGSFNDVTYRLPRAPVEDRWMRETVALDSMYAYVCRCIQDDELGVIGLYGMGGVGKTTLMAKVNNEFIKTSKEFEVAIWVEVSKSPSVGNVQEVIRNKLDIPDERWRNRSEDEKAAEIFNVLKGKRFVMLFDDLWKRLDLQKVGVPFPDNRNKSKVILTARSKDVCRDMEAHTSILVKCLNQDDAITLFKNRVRASTLEAHPDMPKLAEVVAKECKGLLLALVTIGRAMADKNRREDWLQAIEKLRTHPSKIPGMENHLFSGLKLSYDNLENETTQLCFLYLALFRKDYKIVDHHLINLWIGEGFLDEYENLHEARKQGSEIIEQLKAACLFESHGDRQVKMHYSVRDMALWLASNSKNKILVIEDDTLEAQPVPKWQETQRMSLWIDSTGDLALPSFSNLVTLIVKSKVAKPFCRTGLFCLMMLPAIKVLDLSRTSIWTLPHLFGELVTLEYLDLSYTNLKILSSELRTLTRLKCLILDQLPCLQISKEVISNLSSLKLFSMQVYPYQEKEKIVHASGGDEIKLALTRVYIKADTVSGPSNQALLEELEGLEHINDVCFSIKGAVSTGVYIKADTVSGPSNQALLEELEGLEHINDVCFSIKSAVSFQKFLSSQKLRNHVRSLGLENLEGMASLQVPRMKHVHELIIGRCEELKEIEVDLREEGRLESADYIPNLNFRSLRRVLIHLLPKMLDLTWLIYLPSVEVLEVIQCGSIKEIIQDKRGVSQDLGMFSTLRVLRLDYLPNLRSICGQALPFPCLTDLWVSKCPQLRKLPLNCNCATNSLKAIRGDLWWWERLQWEDITLKRTFDPLFIDIKEKE